MSAQIKICGVTTTEALEAAIGAGASYVGLNFYPPSPRFADAETAGLLGRTASGRIPLVGVFVDPTDEEIEAAVAHADLAALQLNRTTALRRLRIRERFGLPVWAVIEVESHLDTLAVNHIDAADFMLWDAKTPKGSALPGGMGHSFDWSLIASVTPPLPWGLAGGLDPQNVAEAIAATGAPLVDTASGVERAPGVKDAALIRAFCMAARAA
ncbi:phosphoribosylanthranilate isomerase [Qipengyuania soli]|uniref:N-(5'-phosphoribosyl)anthranilate isomerase n=1 Tax=Qipengyuania soli TaxID=2782568 RepID=A0A7S8IVT1_9SPHN|nr:phosphoribosylanthranilate isomerase [Qipengyuania soli]QPD00278.1 phosphoribosylanthranilate isomerase [Qipengyuania soli]